MNKNPIFFFINNTKYEESDIKFLKKVHKGFTNESFFLFTKDKKKWQVRFTGLNDVVKRENENEVLKIIENNNYIYYDNDGNSIREWIEGKNLSLFFNKKTKLKLLCEEINKLHSIEFSKCKNIILNDYLIYMDKTKNLQKEIKEKYIYLINKYKDLEKVISHNDLSPANIIYKNKKIIFIDYEWARINDNYFDIANFIRESNLSLKWLYFFSNNLDNVKYDILKEYIFIVTCFAYQWTFIANEDSKLLKYRKKCFKKMNSLYKKIFYNNFG